MGVRIIRLTAAQTTPDPLKPSCILQCSDWVCDLRVPRDRAGDCGAVAEYLAGLTRRAEVTCGGNIESYAKVCEAAREEAYQRMLEHAKERRADALIGVRYDATEFAPGVTEVLAYGTAVKLSRS